MFQTFFLYVQHPSSKSFGYLVAVILQKTHTYTERNTKLSHE